MTCTAVSGLSLLDNFEQEVKFGLSASTLDNMTRDLLCLRAALPPARWTEFCRGEFQQLPDLLGRHGFLGLLEDWEHTLPSAAAMLSACRLFEGEIAETRRLTPQPSILALDSHPFPPISQPSFDLIYSAQRLNLCANEAALIWLEAAARLLRPGGRLIAANLTPGGRDAAYLDARWNLRPFYRDEHSLAHLASSLPDEGLRGHAVFRDDTGAMAFLEIQAA